MEEKEEKIEVKDELQAEEKIDKGSDETIEEQINASKKEAKAEEEKPLSDDELYTKIQTEKLLKSQKAKKISMISILSVVFALAVVIICLASIPLNLKPDFMNLDYVAEVYIDGEPYSGTLSSDVNTEEYNTLRELVDDVFNQTYFSGLFNGSLIGYNISETNRQTLSSFNSTLQNDSSNDYIRLEFAEPQTLRNKDGSVYTSSWYPNTVLSFDFQVAYLMLSDEAGDDTVTFYFVVQYINSNTGNAYDDGKEYVISMTTVGETYPIFNHFNPNSEE